MMKHCFALLFFLFASGSFCQAQQDLHMRYDHPAGDKAEYKIEEALPLGNGHLGAMPDGQVTEETVILNDITLWSGSKQDANRPGAAKHLPGIRKAIFSGQYSRAEQLVNQYFVCSGAGSHLGHGINVPYGSYQVLGRLHIRYHYDSSPVQPSDYTRSLSLDSAMVTTSYKVDGVTYHREYFTSFSDDVVMIRIAADQPGKVNIDLSLDRPERYRTTVVHGNELQMSGQLNDGYEGTKGVKYLTRMKVQKQGGTLMAGDSTLSVRHADAVVLYIAEASDFFEKTTTAFYKPDFNYKKYVAENLRKAVSKLYSREKEEHLQRYQQRFHRATLRLGTQAQETTHRTLPQRLRDYVKDKTDTNLPVLYFQFGRYLSISSTRPGWLPPNLQGLWANKVNTQWSADYHLNINLQMNHWPLEETNLPLLNEPYYTLVKGLVKPGEKTAKVYYNVDKGWVSHPITNVWGFTAPGEAASWGSSNSGSGWLANLLWRHYAFDLNRNYLKKIYPIIKGSAQFYLHALVEDPNNDYLVTAPSSSPENAFKYESPGGEIKTASVCAGPTIDNQIIRELFNHVIEAAKTLHRDEKLVKKLVAVKKRLPPNQIDQNGRLMEWLHPFQLTNPHHRHMSPLWGLYPGTEISFEKDSTIARAAEKLMIQRGYASSFGWSDGWKMNLWARLGDGNRAFSYLNYILKPADRGGHAFPNLFDAYGGHHSVFQIDANFGATAGIAEMLLQSQSGKIKLLPALPDAWPSGKFHGFRVRGGGVVDASWSQGNIEQMTLQAEKAHTFKIMIPEHREGRLSGRSVSHQANDGLLTVTMEKGQVVHVVFKEK